MTLRGGRRLASRGGLALAGLLALVLLLAGLLHIPSVQGAIRTRLAREAGRALSAEVEVASLRWDLFRGLVSAGGLVVRGRDARSGTALSVESVRLSFSPAELLRGRLRLRQVRIVRPEARLRLDAWLSLIHI